MRERERILEGVLVASRLAEGTGDASEVRGGKFAAFGDPFLEDVGGAAFGESKPEYSALEIIVFAISILMFFILRSMRLFDNNFVSRCA